MGKVVGIVVLVLALSGSAQAATKPKPKPWAWTTAGAIKALDGTNPAIWGDGSLRVTKCAGKGKAVAKHYLSFACVSTSPQKATLFVRVRPYRRGEPCVSLKSLAAVPQACLAPSGARTTNDPDDARVALAKGLGKQLGMSFPYQGPTGCYGFGAGYFECWYGADDPAAPTNGLATVVMSPSPVVTITKPFSG